MHQAGNPVSSHEGHFCGDPSPFESERVSQLLFPPMASLMRAAGENRCQFSLMA